jgi:hypothetical protein
MESPTDAGTPAPVREKSREERRADAEEERVRIKGPPPLWDENLPPGCTTDGLCETSSYIFSLDFKKIEKAVSEGVPLKNISISTATPIQVNIVTFAVTYGDLPLLRFCGRFDADFEIKQEIFGESVTPLGQLLLFMDTGCVPIGQRQYDGFRWMITRGVNPNGDGGTMSHGSRTMLTVFQKSASLATTPAMMDLCKLMVDYGADIASLRSSPRKPYDNIVRELEAYAAARTAANTAMPPVLCPCGNDVAVSECHGAKDGVPLHPRQYCGCKSGKVYAKCCFKRRYFYRETLKTYLPPPRILAAGDSAGFMYKQLQRRETELLESGMSKEELGKMKLVDMLMPGVEHTADSLNAMQQRGMLQIAQDMADVDPCFKYAIGKCEFHYARPWKSNGMLKISKHEGEKRRDEWNADVDEYIAKKTSLGDTRSDEDIARQCKVDANGAALWKRCTYPACPIQETTPGQFKSCAKCRIVHYCGQNCQREHWPTHKKECGQDHTEHFLPSQRALNEKMSTVSAALPNGDAPGCITS